MKVTINVESKFNNGNVVECDMMPDIDHYRMGPMGTDRRRGVIVRVVTRDKGLQYMRPVDIFRYLVEFNDGIRLWVTSKDIKLVDVKEEESKTA